MLTQPSTTGNQEQRRRLGQPQRFERQLKDPAEVNDKVHFQHNTTPSRLAEMAVLSNAQKPTKRVKENKEIEEYILDVRTR